MLLDYTLDQVLDPDWSPPMGDMTRPEPRPEDELERRLREEALPPRDPFTDALDAYRARFGETPTFMGLSSARYPALAAELWAAVRDGVPRSDADIRRALGMGSPPLGVEV